MAAIAKQMTSEAPNPEGLNIQKCHLTDFQRTTFANILNEGNFMFSPTFRKIFFYFLFFWYFSSSEKEENQEGDQDLENLSVGANITI